MRCTVAIIAKHGCIDARECRDAQRRMCAVLPYRHLSYEVQEWTTPNADCALITALGGPPADRPACSPLTVDPDGCTLVHGYVVGDVPKRPRNTREVSDFREALDNLGGVFSVLTIDIQSGTVCAYCSLTRVEAMFWYEDADRIVISNRALLTHLVGRQSDQPEYNLDSLPSFLNAGFFASEEVPFANTNMVPSGSTLVISQGKSSICDVTRELLESAAESESSMDYDAAADALAHALLPLKDVTQDIHVGLTGGKDSRLLVAAMKAIEVPFRTFIVDYGDANAADVAVSRLVAKALDVEHDVRRGATSDSRPSSLTVDLYKKSCEHLLVTDGMLSAYESVPKRSGFPNAVTIAGNGGELLRGGYALNRAALSERRVRDVLRSMFTSHHTLLRSQFRRGYRTFVDRWPSRLPGEPARALEWFYLLYRCGRWSSAARAGYAAFQPLYQPFFDSRAIGHVLRTPFNERAREIVVWRILRRLAPSLAKLPFASKFWIFQTAAERERVRSDHSDLFQSTATTERGNRDWRLTYAHDLRPEMKRQIMDGGGSEALFEVVNRKAVRKLLESDRLPNREYKLLVFNLYTLSVLLSNDWLRPIERGRPVTVELSRI